MFSGRPHGTPGFTLTTIFSRVSIAWSPAYGLVPKLGTETIHLRAGRYQRIFGKPCGNFDGNNTSAPSSRSGNLQRIQILAHRHQLQYAIRPLPSIVPPFQFPNRSYAATSIGDLLDTNGVAINNRSHWPSLAKHRVETPIAPG